VRQNISCTGEPRDAWKFQQHRNGIVMEASARGLRTAEESEGSNSSESSFSSRARKSTGAQSTWRQLTNEERLVSTSLTQLRDQNLSLHLYNAHAMKRRHYVPSVISEQQLKPWNMKVGPGRTRSRIQLLTDAGSLVRDG
jgi:hypothetical protein